MARLYSTPQRAQYSQRLVAQDILVIGTTSLDTLHIAGQTYQTIGGAGLYTALAAHYAGAHATLLPESADYESLFVPGRYTFKVRTGRATSALANPVPQPDVPVSVRVFKKLKPSEMKLPDFPKPPTLRTPK